MVAKLAEMDMVVADLERANTRAATVERRNVNDFFSYLMLSQFRAPQGTPARRDRVSEDR